MTKLLILAISAILAVALAGCGESQDLSFSTPNPAVQASCPFDAGALPADTLPASAPHGDQIPIEHIIVVMQENRSFDNYFGQLPAA
jgi:phospholipase C